MKSGHTNFNLIPWLKLMRVSAAPTAAANVLAASLLAVGQLANPSQILALMAASMAAYTAGMVLNDVCDYETDLKFRPERPIAAGQIGRGSAFGLYLVLVAISFLFSSFVGWYSAYLTFAITLAVIAYTFVFKRTSVAPVFMGLCRFLNYLLGATIVGEANIADVPGAFWWIATSLGIFIAGLTWLARNENRIISPQHLRFSAMAVVAGLSGMLAAPFFIWFIGAGQSYFHWLYIFIMLYFFIAVGKNLRGVLGQSDPARVRKLVGNLIRSLILFDAAFCLLAESNQILGALAVLVLLIPAKWLSRPIATT